MQREVHCTGYGLPRQHSLELGSRFQPLHVMVAPALRFYKTELDCSLDNQARALNCQALATFGTARINYSTASTSLHTHQKTMGAGAANFGRLIGTFHFEIR
jgi:hypothetical protein